MKNDQNMIDDLFRDALNDYREEKPSQNLWSRISMHMLLQMLSGGRVFSILLLSLFVLIPFSFVVNNSLKQGNNSSIVVKQDTVKENEPVINQTQEVSLASSMQVASSNQVDL